MTKQAVCSFRLALVASLIVSLTASLLCGVARADDHRADKSFRLRAEAFAPIGKVYSLGEISINGRSTHGEQMIWGGETLQVTADSSGYVFLDSVGQITLKNGAIAKLAAAQSSIDDKDSHFVLVASLTSGEMAVKLQVNAEAYIETCGSTFTSSSGADFRITIRGQQALIDQVSGSVTDQCKDPTKRRKLWISCCVIGGALVANSFPRTIRRGQKLQGVTVRLRMQECSQIRKTLFASLDGHAGSQTTQGERPASGRRLRFEVHPAIGQISATSFITDLNGDVPVDFVSLKEGTATITITVEDIRPDEEFEPLRLSIVIVKPPIPLWAIIVPPAVIGGIVCAIACHKKSGPIRQVPPPKIP